LAGKGWRLIIRWTSAIHFVVLGVWPNLFGPCQLEVGVHLGKRTRPADYDIIITGWLTMRILESSLLAGTSARVQDCGGGVLKEGSRSLCAPRGVRSVD